MQASPIVAVADAVAPNVAQASGTGDPVVQGGVDFSALLAAQIKGGKDVRSVLVEPGVEGKEGAANTKESLDALSADESGAAGVDANGAALLVAAVGLPTAPIVAAADTNATLRSPSKDGGELSALPGGVAREGVAQLLTADGRTPASGVSRGLPLQEPFPGPQPASTDDAASQPAREAADFAVSGKSLPQATASLKDSLPITTQDRPQFQPSLDSTGNGPLTQSVMSPVPTGSAAPTQQTVGTPASSLPPPVGSNGWGDALGQKVVWMAGQQQQTAELHLNPPHLGPLEVRVTISNDQVSAVFVSHQPAVRDAIEAAMPRLREMFADSGMTLGNAMVSSDSLPQHQASGQGAGFAPSPRQPDGGMFGLESGSMQHGGVLPLRHGGTTLVDFFA